MFFVFFFIGSAVSAARPTAFPDSRVVTVGPVAELYVMADAETYCVQKKKKCRKGSQEKKTFLYIH